MYHKKILSLFFLASLFLFFGCKSEENPVIPVNTGGEVTQYGVPFADVPETKGVIMYEINLRAFNSQGNLAGIEIRLDSIKALGVNVIWLMPIHPVGKLKSVGQLGSPYSVQDYNAVNPEFGTLDDLRRLVEKAHQKGIAVILDWVANHTAWDNPWIANKSWYTQDGSGNIIIPAGTNWQDVADLNYNSQEMRATMIKAMKYWVLAANIDGFRCDAADMIPLDFWKQAIDSLKTIPNRKLILLAEGARLDHYTAGFQLTYGWDYYNKIKSVFQTGETASNIRFANATEYNFLPAGSHRLRFTSNHDECAWFDTPLGNFKGKAGSMAAFVLTVFNGGVPLIYNGQEVGCSVKLPFFSKSPIDWTTNPDMMIEYKNILSFRRENATVKEPVTAVDAHADVVLFSKKLGSEEVLVIVNVRNTTVNYQIPMTWANSIWRNALGSNLVTLGTSINLEPYKYYVLIK